MKVTVIPIIAGALETVSKGLEKYWKSEEESSTIQTIAVFDRLEYSEDFWVPEETCNHSDSSGRPRANVGMEN